MDKRMRKKLWFLFLCNLLVWGTVNGLVPLLPVNAGRFGASASVTGLYLAFSYLAMATGTMAAPWLWRRLGGPQRVLAGASLFAAVAFVLIGQAPTMSLLVSLTAVAWMACGLLTTTLSMVLAVLADPAQRGRSFGWMALAVPAGALMGGLSFGALIQVGGFSLLFGALGVVWLALPWIGTKVARGLEQIAQSPSTQSETPTAPAHSVAFSLIVATVWLLSLAIFMGRLGTTYAMQTLAYAPEQIARAAGLGGLIALPVIPVLGALSDRFGRRGLVSFCCLVGAGGLLLLARATAQWEFALASGLMSIATYAGTPLMLALAVDLLPAAARNWGLSLCTTAIWLAGIFGFAVAGRLLDSWGIAPPATGAAVLALLTALLPLIFTVRRWGAKPAAAAA
jgi:MFS family permease